MSLAFRNIFNVSAPLSFHPTFLDLDKFNCLFQMHFIKNYTKFIDRLLKDSETKFQYFACIIQIMPEFKDFLTPNSVIR